MDERIQKYYLEQDYNCAETVLHILNDRYHLSLEDRDFRLIGGFGGGCGCGDLCGTLAGCIAALGCLKIQSRAHEDPAFRELCAELTGRFSAALGSTDCAQIRSRCFRDGVRCAAAVEAAIRCFDALAAEKGIAPLE